MHKLASRFLLPRKKRVFGAEIDDGHVWFFLNSKFRKKNVRITLYLVCLTNREHPICRGAFMPWKIKNLKIGNCPLCCVPV